MEPNFLLLANRFQELIFLARNIPISSLFILQNFQLRIILMKKITWNSIHNKDWNIHVERNTRFANLSISVVFFDISNVSGSKLERCSTHVSYKSFRSFTFDQQVFLVRNFNSKLFLEVFDQFV